MFQTRVRHHRRYQEITNTFIKNGFSHILFRLGLTDRPSGRKAAITGTADDNLTDIGMKLRSALQSLGPTFIKLGQIASSRRDIVPEEIAIELEKLQDDVLSFDYEIVQETIIRELEDTPENLFAEFNKEPLATASIGQVHIAKLHTGEEVAIKIQRPDIESIITTDLEILHNLACMLDSRVQWAKTYRIKEIIEEFSYSLKNELDYLLEGRNGERIAEQFEDNEHIHVPKIFWDYTTDKVLTMEMIHGIKVNKYEELEELNYDKKLIASRIADAMLHQILDAGFFHGDPHPGNIYVLPDNRVAFLDFGMVGQLSNDLKYYFSSLVISLQSGDTDGMLNTFNDWGLLDNVDNINALRRDMDALQLKYYDVPLHHISLGGVMIEVFSIAYKHHIEIPTDIAVLGKAILTLETILENLDPELSIMDAVEPYGKRLLLKRYNPLRIARKSWRSLLENITIISELPRDLKDISTAMKRGKLQFDINIFEIQYILNKLDRIANRISFSVILLAFSILMMGLIIGASIVGETTVLWRLPVIEVGFVIATLMFLFMVFVIIRSGRM
ncbi:MAG TPA: AarF/ABC1/UbiB kinase family protein [Pseudogracilibacillus sp.]|nr:AarF/ABC1/UbiB kinase family protein [Pseudogracilibacillus sp.]